MGAPLDARFCRVTEPLDFFKTENFYKWRLRVGEREANAVGKKAAAIGSRIDEIVKSGVYQLGPKEPKAVKNCFTGFMKWRERHQVGTLIALQRLYDERIWLSGEPDLLWVEKRCLIDLKGAKTVWPHYFFQLGGYKRLGVDVDSVAILRLDPEEAGAFEFISNELLGLTLPDLVDAYESAFKHYKYYTCIEQRIKGETDGNQYATEISSNA